MANNSKPRTIPPSLLACITCRKRHLKCDARMPACGRCESRQLDCLYVESRRGYKGSRRKETATESDGTGSDSHGQLFDLPSTSTRDQWPSTAVETSLDGPPRSHSGSTSTMSLPRDTMALSKHHHMYDDASVGDDLIDLYYVFFFPAHPFLIPRKLFIQQPDLLPEYLRAVMRFVGSQYQTTSQDPGNYRHDMKWFLAANMILADSVPNSAFKVQGLVLFAMALFARFEQERGAVVLEKAIDTALLLGMNQETFCRTHDQNNPILRESWRRTWWDIYVVDGLLSAMGGSSHVSRLHQIPTDVCLPTTCAAYTDCHLHRLRTPTPRTLSEMQHRSFEDDNYPYSSYAYKIEAVRIMSTVLSLSADTFATTDPEIEVVDASITNFLLSLPPSKRDVIEREGSVDEVLFGAHMVIHWAAILLHRPRSNFIFIKNHYRTACTREESTSLPATSYSTHASKALCAANKISTLATNTTQTTISQHTPCYACAVALSATVHLPAYALAETPQEAHAIKERLQLSVSTLGNMGETWPMARVVKGQVAQFARDVFLPPPTQQKRADTGVQQQQQMDFESMMSNEEWLEELCTFHELQSQQ